jgi:outer membrane protein assembly factor BamB
MSGSNYLANRGKFNPYTTAPNSAHIIWTKELAFGGLVGGDFSTAGYYTGQSYESRLNPPIVMNGRIYYNTPDPPRYGFYCVDLRTGEELWFQNGTGMPAVYMHNVVRWGAINLGQLYYYNSPNQHGVIPYLWSTTGSTWSIFDAFTGNWILNLENATTGLVSFTLSNTVFGPSGELLVYALDGSNNWLAMWNSSLAIPTANTTSTGAWHWRPDDVPGREIDWTKGIQWNKTVPDVPGVQSITKIGDGVVYARVTLDTVPPVAVHVAYDATTGQQKWVQNRTGNLGLVTTYSGLGPMGEGVYTEYVKETLQWYGFDIDTGNQLWETDPYNTTDWAMYGAQATIAYGRLFTTSYDGYVHCYNLTNGQLMWKYSTEKCGLETPYGNYPFFGAVTIADGKAFATPGEHSPNHPLYRGQELLAIDVETGKLIWNITGMYENYRDMGLTIAEGYLVALNGYDNRLYCFGKGQTATTVSGSPEVSAHGDTVLIKGTVTDQSPEARGTAAVSDESMSAWMEYLYMQKPCPANVKGVEVTLDTVDPNGNFVHIGTVTSDASGLFSHMFTPEVPGKYTIIATFAGSESYWSSYAETAIGVDEAPPATAPPEYPQPIDNTLTIVGATIAIIIAVALVGIWIKRK